jgi:hypothetical protein
LAGVKQLNKQLNNNEWSFEPLFRVAGYALLALSLLDLIEIFVPPRFGNPTWELQLVNNLVERAPVPLLGLVLVLVGEQSFRIFKFLSWACLAVGLLFLLLVPLAANSSFLIAQQNKLEISNQLNQRTAQVQQLRNVLNQATTDQEINSVLTRLNPQGRLPESNNPQQSKSQVLSELAQGEKRLKSQAEANRASRELTILKNAVKLSLGALFSGAVFLLIWRKTGKVLKVSKQRSRTY